MGSNLVSSNLILYGNGVINMPESISAPKSGSFEYKENTGSQMGHADKKIFWKKNYSMSIPFNFDVGYWATLKTVKISVRDKSNREFIIELLSQ